MKGSHFMKFAIFDLDGTLFDTKKVNYLAYKEALSQFGYDLNYKYFLKFCNGRHYKTFLPAIATHNESILIKIHQLKIKQYHKYIDKAIPNKNLFSIIKLMQKSNLYKIAIVTTASKSNCYELLKRFDVFDLFDLIITQEDISKPKPDPEGFLKAIEIMGAKATETLIFEDSDVGIEAAQKSGAECFRVFTSN